MKVTKKAKGIILAGVVAITISAAITTNVAVGTIAGSTIQKAGTSAIDPPGG